LRPKHEDAATARVVTVDRGRFGCLVDGDALVVAMRARELGRRAIAVGDEVEVVGDLGGGPDALARIVRIAERQSTLRRSADDSDPVERVLVANAEQLVVVAASAEPAPQPRLIDRCLVAAYDAGIAPILCITKSDLATAEELAAIYRDLDLRVIRSGRPGFAEAVAELRSALDGKVTALVGSSGVGKSTLVNELVPDAAQRIGEVSARTGKGQHTTTAAIALPLPGSGWVIDTPGIRSFGLAHVTADDVLAAFDDLEQASLACPPMCGHTAEDPDCALDGWAQQGPPVRAERLASFRRLLDAVGQVGP
jgi:ribosome biogenesis GTPase